MPGVEILWLRHRVADEFREFFLNRTAELFGVHKRDTLSKMIDAK
jgi:hypothetical protein